MLADIFLRVFFLQTVVIEALRSYCFFDNLQRQYCLNELVLKATVIEVGHTDEHTIGISQVYKGNVNELNKMGNGTVILKAKTEYLLSGKQYLIFGNDKNGTLYSKRCNGILPVSFLNQVQEDSLEIFYQPGCDCVDQIGTYSHEVFCEWRYGYMEKYNDNCTWSGGVLYKRCESGNSISTTSTEEMSTTSTEEISTTSTEET